jgi:predicted nucleic acid-binding protein
VNVLVDTNVWLDIFLARQPFAPASGKAVSLLDDPDHGLFVGATTVTTIFYLVERAKGRKMARRKIRALLDRCRVAPVDGDVLRSALEDEFDDYEDAVLHSSAHAAHLDAIVTRNPSDFAEASLRVYTPTEFVASQKQGS